MAVLRNAVLSIALAATRGLVGDWAAHLADTVPDSAADALRQHTRTGRPFGSHTFTSQLEHALARRLTPAKRGRPKRQRADTEKG